MQRIVEDESGYEQWENVTAGRVVLKRLSKKGDLTDELIGGRRKFLITPAERRLNQEMAADETLDHFQNGILTPVRLIETAEDVEKITSNPNHVSETEMTELLGNPRAIKAFEQRVATISNPIALSRFLEIAKRDDRTTARQLGVIEERLKAVSPSLFTEVQSVSGPASTGMKPVSPR